MLAWQFPPRRRHRHCPTPTTAFPSTGSRWVGTGRALLPLLVMALASVISQFVTRRFVCILFETRSHIVDVSAVFARCATLARTFWLDISRGTCRRLAVHVLCGCAGGSVLSPAARGMLLQVPSKGPHDHDDVGTAAHAAPVPRACGGVRQPLDRPRGACVWVIVFSSMLLA